MAAAAPGQTAKSRFVRWRETFARRARQEEAPTREEDRWDVEQARAAAVREVSALLAKPENLGRLGKLCAEAEAQRSAVQVQVSLVTGRQAEEARAGIAMLARCRENVRQVRGVTHRLAASIDESEAALPQYAALRQAFVTRRNLERTVADLDAIVVMPVEIARIEAELSKLTSGELTRTQALRANPLSSERGGFEPSPCWQCLAKRAASAPRPAPMRASFHSPHLRCGRELRTNMEPNRSRRELSAVRRLGT